MPFGHRDLETSLEQDAATLVDAIWTVRHELGARLVESVYVECLAAELRARGVAVQTEVRLPITYRGAVLEKTFRVDLLAGDAIIVEAKAVDELHPAHFAHTLTYLTLSKKPLAFLVNFNAVPLGGGIHRLIRSSAR